MKLRITQVARQDLRDIESYSVEHWGEKLGFAYSDRIRLTLAQLVRAEVSGQAADAISPGLRRQLVASHTIWFRLRGDDLLLVRVLHQSRDVGRALG